MSLCVLLITLYLASAVGVAWHFSKVLLDKQGYLTYSNLVFIVLFSVWPLINTFFLILGLLFEYGGGIAVRARPRK